MPAKSTPHCTVACQCYHPHGGDGLVHVLASKELGHAPEQWSRARRRIKCTSSGTDKQNSVSLLRTANTAAISDGCSRSIELGRTQPSSAALRSRYRHCEADRHCNRKNGRCPCITALGSNNRRYEQKIRKPACLVHKVGHENESVTRSNTQLSINETLWTIVLRSTPSWACLKCYLQGTIVHFSTLSWLTQRLTTDGPGPITAASAASR